MVLFIPVTAEAALLGFAEVYCCHRSLSDGSGPVVFTAERDGALITLRILGTADGPSKFHHGTVEIFPKFERYYLLQRFLGGVGFLCLYPS